MDDPVKTRFPLSDYPRWLREPEDREQLIDLLRSAHARELLDADALSITEGALSASETAVRDVMVPRAQMDMLDIGDPPQEIMRTVIAAAHSRFRCMMATATT